MWDVKRREGRKHKRGYMRKIIVGAQVSMDGVIQPPGGPSDLVDALSIFTVPIVLGGGKKLFADGSAPHSFNLTGSRVSPNGLIVGHYARGGELKIGGTELDSPSERELARQERMKREG
jgi:hypothetical protein